MLAIISALVAIAQRDEVFAGAAEIEFDYGQNRHRLPFGGR
jgi:hypothetical protein